MVIGHGPWHAQLSAAALQYPQLILVSAQGAAQLKDYYQRSKLFLSLSRNESFGLVMTEAMACGTPVVATTTDGSRMQIQHGSNGYLVDTPDEVTLLQALGEKIQLLLSLPPADYQQLQQACQTSAQPYLLDKVAARLTQIYQQLTTKPADNKE
jgi:glycosyltransferase involved in cell wall biosynthesis